MSPPRHAVGVDVGGTSIKFGLVGSDGTVLRHLVLATEAEQGPDHVLERVAEGIRRLGPPDDGVLSGVGMGVPGVVDADGNVCYPPNFPEWDVVPVAERLRPLLEHPLPVAVENDANTAALAEARVGSGSDEPNFLFVTLGTGVGGCIIMNGEIQRGATGGAGEVGHVSVDMNGQLCNCGSRGCVEAYLGQRYMSEHALRRLDRFPDSLLHKHLSDRRELDPKLLSRAADAGDLFARSFLAEMGDILGAALASAVTLLDLHLVIVGGGVAEADRWLLDPARRSITARSMKSVSLDVRIRRASLGNSAGVIGAALLVLPDAGK